MPYVQITLSKYELIVMLKIICPFHNRVILETGQVKPSIEQGKNIYTKPIFNVVNTDTKIA